MRESYGFIAAVCIAVWTAAGPAGPAAAEPLEVTIQRLDCQRLVRHVPDADVPAEYVPGVDVRGDPVVPADLYGPNPIRLPETFTFTLQVNPFGRLDARALESERRILAGRIAQDPDNGALRAQLRSLDRRAAQLDGRPEAATELGLGQVSVTRDGRVYFDGRPLQDDAQWYLAALCRRALDGSP
jgi:hypothetical protein